MAAIKSSMGYRNEVKLQNLFSRPVRFHLLYKSSFHGVSVTELLSRFDDNGHYIIVVILQSGSIRGAYFSESLKNKRDVCDAEAFVFDVNEKDAKCFPVRNPAKAAEVQTQPIQNFQTFQTLNYGSVQTITSISIGDCLVITSDNGSMRADFKPDAVYGTAWPVEDHVNCTVELHRVEDLGDFLAFPWREMSWTDETREKLRQDFVSHKTELKKVNALLLGPVGSGKSSFINSVRSTMYGRVVHLSNIGPSVNGFTKKLTTYDIRAQQRGPSTVLKLCDVRGLRDEDVFGLIIADAMNVIKGHVAEGYQFQSENPITVSVEGYRAEPCLEEKIHCVLFVLDASKVTSYSSGLKSRLRELYTNISELGISFLILLTHVDQVCPAVQQDLSCVYSSRTVQEKMQNAADLVGMPLSYVLPVKNYTARLTVDRNTDILILNAISTILQAVDDSFEDQSPQVTDCMKSIAKIEHNFRFEL